MDGREIVKSRHSGIRTQAQAQERVFEPASQPALKAEEPLHHMRAGRQVGRRRKEKRSEDGISNMLLHPL